MADVLTVRAHHLVCLAHHAVFGDEHPTLPVLLKAVREDPGRCLRVVVGPDDICLPCPHWNGTLCVRQEGMEEKNRVKDARFLEVLGLSDGEESPARDVYDRVAERVTFEVLQDICPTCSAAECADAVRRSWLEDA